ncbi:MAG: hypothetical protein R3E01_07335 [Pirellulaceae bacterium]
MTIIKRILAAVLGLIAGGMTVALVEGVSSLMHPIPEGLETDDWEGMSRWIATLPVTAFLMLLVAWGAGCFVGACIARLVAPRRSILIGMLVGVLFTVATVFNLVAFPHPWWMWPSGILVCLVGTAFGTLAAAAKEYRIATTCTIDAPITRVFQTLANIKEFSKAVPDITNIQFMTEQQYGVGTRFKETRIMNGREATTELQVTELVENERIRIVSDAGGTIWDTVFKVRDQNAAVVMDMQMDARPYNLAARLFVPMILGMVSKAVEADMDAVKTYLEKDTITPRSR